MSANPQRSSLEPSTAPRAPAQLLTRVLLLLCTFGMLSSARAEAPPAPSDPSAGDEPVFSFDSPVGPIEYRAGRGLHLGRTGLNIGGFTTVEFDRDEGEPGELALDGINFLVLFEPVDFLRGFAEFEIGDLFLWETNQDDVASDVKVEIERLYGDLSLDDPYNLRFGKFQTPVGRWNLVPAEPFVWTANEPVLVERAFDEYQTGAAFFGSVYPGGRTLNYWISGQFLDPLDAEDDEDDPEPFERSVGGRLEYGGPLEQWSIGSSFLASELNGDWTYLGGLDAEWHIGPLELSGEFAISEGDVPDRDLWGVYVQGVLSVGRGFYLVGRYEHFDPSGRDRDADLADLGIAWIPLHFLHLKADYRFSDHQTEDVRRGLSVSFSVLF